MKFTTALAIFLFFFCIHAFGQEPKNIDKFKFDGFQSPGNSNLFIQIDNKEGFVVQFPNKNIAPRRPISYSDKIESENFSVEFSWKSSSPNEFSNPNIRLGHGGYGGTFFSFDCNGARVTLSSGSPAEWSNSQIKNKENKPVNSSPINVYFLGDIKNPNSDFNTTKINFQNQFVTVLHNNVEAYRFSLNDASDYFKKRNFKNLGENKIANFDSTNNQSIFFSQVLQNILEANKAKCLFLSIQSDSNYLDRKDCRVHFSKFSIYYENLKNGLEKTSDDVKLLKEYIGDSNLKNLLKLSKKFNSVSMVQMPILSPFQVLGNIETPSICKNGSVFFPYKEKLGIPANAFYGGKQRNENNTNLFPKICVNHLYCNGSIFIYLWKNEPPNNHNMVIKYLNYLKKDLPNESRVISGKTSEFDIFAIIENSVSTDVDAYIRGFIEKLGE